MDEIKGVNKEEIQLVKKSIDKVDNNNHSHESVTIGIITERELSRELGFKEALSIGLGGTIGGGVFSVLGIVIGFAGPAAILSFLFGGILGILFGYSYAKLSVKYQSAGGSYTFAKAAYGDKFGGIFGWLLWIGYLASCSLYAYTFGIYFAHLIDIITPSDLVENGWIRLIFSIFSTLIIGLSTLVNLKGVKETGKSQNIIVLAKLIILLTFIAITIPAAIRGAKENLSDFFIGFDGEPTDNIIQGLALAVVGTSILFVAFEGMELIPNASEEIQNPEKNIPRSIYTTIIIASIIYLLVAFTTLGGTSYKVFVDDPSKAEYALAYAAQPILGIAGFILITIGALFSTASAFNASLYGSSRLAYVMAREKVFPTFFSKVSKKGRVPYISILLISGIILVMTLTLNLEQIAKLASSIFLLLFSLMTLSSLILRKNIKAKFIIPFFGFILSTSLFGIFIWNLIKEVINKEEGALITIILLPILIILVGIGSYFTMRIQTKQKKQNPIQNEE
ncbi:MAG TPA: APC family permease [Candidatus Bathyarchaeia archaeon]|nr:APC family permease [Candidatus Bathyarchaeia archaeon]